MSFENTCHHCGAPAVKLCDFTIGYTSDDGLVGLDSERITCSRPLCDECATQEGTIFFSDGADTIDYCRDHAGQEHERLNPKPLMELLTIKRRLQMRSVK